MVIATLTKKILKYTTVVSFGLLLSRLFAFLFRVVAARELLLADYGQIVILMNIYTSLMIFSYFRINTSLSYFISKHKVEDRDSLPILYFNGLLCILPTTLLSSVIYIFVLNYYGFLSPLTVLFTTVTFFSVGLIQHNKGVLFGLEKISSVSFLNSLIGITRFTCILVLFYLLNLISALTAFYAFLLSELLPAFFSILMSLRNIRPLYKLDIQIIQRLYSYSFFSTISYLIASILILLPPILISTKSMADTALFDIGLLAVTASNIFLMNLTEVINPLVSERYSKTKKIIKLPHKKILLYFIVVYIVLAIVFSLNIDHILITLLLGNKFEPAIILIRILSISIPFTTYYLISKGVLQGLGRVKDILKADILSLTIALPSFIITAQNPQLLAIVFVIVCIIRGIAVHLLVR